MPAYDPIPDLALSPTDLLQTQGKLGPQRQCRDTEQRVHQYARLMQDRDLRRLTQPRHQYKDQADLQQRAKYKLAEVGFVA